MGLNIHKRLTDLQSEIEGHAMGRVGLYRAVVLGVVSFIVASVVVSTIFSAQSISVDTKVRLPKRAVVQPTNRGKSDMSSLLARLEGKGAPQQPSVEERAPELISVKNPLYRAHIQEIDHVYRWLDDSFIFTPAAEIFYSI